jgi:hypothetical protein
MGLWLWWRNRKQDEVCVVGMALLTRVMGETNICMSCVDDDQDTTHLAEDEVHVAGMARRCCTLLDMVG